jgi:hypothetical protein
MSKTMPARRWLRLRTSPVAIVTVAALLAALGPPAASAQTTEALPPPVAWERAQVPSTPAGLELWDVTAGGPGFIAVGGGFEEGAQVGTAIIWVSEDGRTWQSVPLFGDAAQGIPRAITATPDGYVAVGSGCCPDRAAVWLSPDGLSWERLSDQAAFSDTAMFDVTPVAEGLVAVGCSAVMECMGGLSWTSVDGRTWSQPIPMELLPLGVAPTSAGIMALGASEPYEGVAAFSLSADGVTWSEVVSLSDGGSLHAAIDVPEGILAAGGTFDFESGESDALVATSSDAASWELLPTRRLRGLWTEDVAAREDGLLLVGWRATWDGRVPTTLWTTDLRTFQRGSFPRELKRSGLLYGAAFSEDDTTAVAVGSTVLNRGAIPMVWVNAEPSAEG